LQIEDSIFWMRQKFLRVVLIRWSMIAVIMAKRGGLPTDTFMVGPLFLFMSNEESQCASSQCAMPTKRRSTMSTWTDPDDAPELTKEFFQRAEMREGGKLVRRATGTLTRRGRPPLGSAAKKQVTLRLDAEIVDAFRASGAGWQTRLNDILAKAVKK
jgi:uncharacterized protein (DUF4415 family)